jgi:sugar (pentulose or hexulose) kinase
MRHIGVLDIGKTSVKAVLYDLEADREAVVLRQPNEPVRREPYPHFDHSAIEAFFFDALTDWGRRMTLDGVAVTTHGAAGVLVDGERLALPVLDYEHDGPDETRALYDLLRDPFAETGSPAMPNGLNLGAQLFWLQSRFPDAFAASTLFLPWPQYWGYRLTGVAAADVTSLGCHTDLWNPARGAFSGLVHRQGWTRLMPPVRRPMERLGLVSADLSKRLGLSSRPPVAVGIHDSNASLLPHLLAEPAPFTVISTGTWVVMVAVAGGAAALDEAGGDVVNVDAFGRPAPSARFMGGRLFAQMMEERADLPRVERERVAGIAVAKEVVERLSRIGAAGPVLVEGPFAANPAFMDALRQATGRDVRPGTGATGTARGAALLLADRQDAA